MAARLTPSRGGKPDKQCRDALLMEIAANPKLLRKAALAMLTKASEGDVAAWREVSDRVDGKVMPQVLQFGMDGSEGGVSSIEVVFVKANPQPKVIEGRVLNGNGHDG